MVKKCKPNATDSHVEMVASMPKKRSNKENLAKILFSKSANREIRKESGTKKESKKARK